jgi:DNA replication and repair protein RecF
MRLRELELDEFRSYRRLRLQVPEGGFLAVGPNASGKSTLLEAIAMLATMRSPRTSAEREIANWQSGADLGVPAYARARGVFVRADGVHSLELGLSIEEQTARARKRVRLDERTVRAVDAVGQLKTVLFAPEDVELLAGPPANRRRFLDIAIGQASQPYLRALTRYGRVLEQRNSLLRTLAREGNGRRAETELGFWDAELTLAATDVIAYRLGAIATLSAAASLRYTALAGEPALEIGYHSHRSVAADIPATEQWLDPGQTTRQVVSAAFAAALKGVREEELRRGVTAVGPHRDDFAIAVDGIELGRFGSRGQQRLAVVALKLAELELLERVAGEPPVLLLDDVLSELDAAHRERLTAVLAPKEIQVCLTVTDAINLEGMGLDHLPLLRVERGTIG